MGLNVRVSLPPTTTVKVCWAETATTGTRAAMTVEKRIFEQSKLNQILGMLIGLCLSSKCVKRSGIEAELMVSDGWRYLRTGGLPCSRTKYLIGGRWKGNEVKKRATIKC